MNKGKTWIFEAAVNAYDLNNYVFIDDPLKQNDFLSSDLITADNPESILMRKEHEQNVVKKYSILSDEAKQLIDIVLNTPTDILDLISTKKTNKISKGKIFEMLKNQWKSDKGKEILQFNANKKDINFKTKNKKNFSIHSARDCGDAAKTARKVINEVSDFTKTF
jgi:hypothetical protein